MRYSLAEREDLARRREQWILRTEQGEDPKRVRRALKLKVKIGTLVGASNRGMRRAGERGRPCWNGGMVWPPKGRPP